jgi:hypothetical protein
MIRTQIQLHSKQMLWIKKHALEKGISMAQAIRDSVDFYRYHVETIQTVQKKKKALSIIGSFSTDSTKSN